MPLVFKTLIPILVIILGTAFVVGAYLEQSISKSLLIEEFQSTSERVEGAARELVLSGAFSSTTDPLSHERFQTFVDRVKNSTTARVTLWSPEGTILHSDLASVMGVSVPGQPHVQEVVKTGERLSIQKEEDDGVPIQSAVGTFTDMYFPIVNEREEVIAVTQVHSVLGAVLTPLNQGLRDAGVFVLLGALAVALGITVIFRLLILNPLESAGALARAVSAGDFTPRRMPMHKDELGELAQNLDMMRVRLASLVGNLEEEVEKRTHEVREEQTRLSASLGSLAAGFAIFDDRRQMMYQNKALQTLLELPREADFALLEEELKDIGLSHLYDISLSERKSADLPEVRRGARSFRLFLAPVVMEHTDAPLGAVMLLEDITEAKALERAKDDFLSIASHELRTPLTAIRANASMVRDAVEKTKDQEALAMVDDIHNASVRLIKIVHDFLEVAALERGVPVELQERVDFKEITKSVLEELEPLSKEKKLELTFEPGPVVLVRADADRLKQVVTNLVGNALRYTKEGAVVVALSQEGSMAVLRVRDTGVGISAEHQSLLFKKFQQANRGVMTREHSEGTGLGLYITRLIMESMGGSVNLEQSELGAGSTFRATIPVSNV